MRIVRADPALEGRPLLVSRDWKVVLQALAQAEAWMPASYGVASPPGSRRASATAFMQ